MSYRSHIVSLLGLILLLVQPVHAQQSSEIIVRAKGSTGTETFSVSINDKLVSSTALTVNTSLDYTDFSIDVVEPIKLNDVVRVNFTNDATVPEGDRTLIVDAITVDGIRYESEDPGTYSIGSWDSQLQCEGGFKQQEELHCPGYFEYYIHTLSGGSINRKPVIYAIDNPVVRIGDTLNLRVQAVDADGTVPTLTAMNVPGDFTFDDNGNSTQIFHWTPSVTEFVHGERVTVTLIATDAKDLSITTELQVVITLLDPTRITPPGDTLATLAEKLDLLVGFAAIQNMNLLPDAGLYRDFAAEQFNVVTSENSLKWANVQPQQGEFNFTDADVIAGFAKVNNLVLHGHPLVWHAQLPDWVTSLDANKKTNVEKVMLDHIKALTSKYKGRIKLWDVVNEALEEDGSFRNSIWYQAMKSSYIKKAFMAARASDSGAELIYNDFDVAWFSDKTDAMYNLMKDELEDNTPIDAVGFQMHLDVAFNKFNEVKETFQRFADLGLNIYITELDVTIASDTELTEQAEVYRQVTQACVEQPRCMGIQTWGFTDRYSWLASSNPLPFDEYYQAKPAFTAIQDALKMAAGDEDADEESDHTVSPQICTNGKASTWVFEFNGDKDSHHGLKKNQFRIGREKPYDNTVTILVSDKRGKKKSSEKLYMDVAIGDRFEFTVTKPGANTLNFQITSDAGQKQDIEFKVLCSDKLLKPGAEFGSITLLGSLDGD